MVSKLSFSKNKKLFSEKNFCLKEKDFGNSFFAQGSIEYLVMIAIVIVIGLLVVASLFGSNANYSIVGNSSDKLKQYTQPTMVKAITVVADANDGVIILRNTLADSIRMKSITVSDPNYPSNESVVNTFDDILASSNSANFSISNFGEACACAVGQTTRTCRITVSYIGESDLTYNETMDVPIECVNVVQVSDSALVIGLGEGTLENPRVINSCQELQDMNKHLDWNYVLGGDINCAITSTWNGGAGFSPIGTCVSVNGDSAENLAVAFKGSLVGNGHTISNLYINQPSNNFIGLFGCVDNPVLYSGSVSISNVRLTSVNITGNNYVGGLAGFVFQGTISGSSSTGTLSGGNAGGLIGVVSTYSEISNSNSSVNVTATEIGVNVGGLIGAVIDGGFSVTGCYATGTVSNPSQGPTGGLIGYFAGGILSNSYATGNVSGYGTVGGLIGESSAGTITDVNASGTVISTYEFAGGLIGKITETDINNSLATGAVTTGTDYAGGLIGKAEPFVGVGPYNTFIMNSRATGSVSGNNYVGGLIGYNFANISGFPNIINCSATGNVVGDNESIGGLIGYNSGSPITNSYATGSVSGTISYAGGLIGYNTANGSVENSYATGNISGGYAMGGLIGGAFDGSGTNNSYATGNVDGDPAGGLIGYGAGGSVTNSYATGSVKSVVCSDSDLIGLIDLFGFTVDGNSSMICD